MKRFGMLIGAGLLVAGACDGPAEASFHAVYALQTAPDTFGNGDYGWVLRDKRLVLDGRATRGRAQFRSVTSRGTVARTLPDGSIRPDTQVVEGEFMWRRDTLTVTWYVGWPSPTPKRYETFRVDSGGALLTTIAAGPVIGPAILRVSRYRRVVPSGDHGPPAP